MVGQIFFMEGLKDKPWHKLPAEEIVEFLCVNLSTGLSTDEVRRRQKEFGPNRVTAHSGTPAWLKFLKQFNQPLVYVLLLAVGTAKHAGRCVTQCCGQKRVDLPQFAESR